MKRLLYLGLVLFLFSCGLNTLLEPEQILHKKTLIAYRFPVDDVWQICIMDPDGSNKQVLTSHESLCSLPSWSPDGSKIAYHCDGDLYYYDLVNSREQIITNNLRYPYYHSWSPDGSKLAFRSWIDNKGGALFTINLDGSNLRQLSPEDHDTNDYPSWSPDGQTIVYESDLNIYSVKTDGTANTQLTFGNERDDWKDSPMFSPDGSKIYFRHRSSSRIYMMNPDGSDMKNLTEGIAIGHFSISPDGSKIAFTSSRGESNDIWIMDFDGGNKRNLTNDILLNVGPRWSPDGEWIVYTLLSNSPLSSGPRISEEDYSYIAIMKSDGSEKKIISPIRDSCISSFWASFSPFIEWYK